MKERSSPKFPLRLLKWFCKPDYHNDIEGDLLELYERRVKNLGYRKANWLLYKDVVLLFRPGMIRGFKFYQTLNPFFMLKHHLKIAFRLALRYKGYSAINLFGLAVGISCFLIIMLYIQDELSYDQYLQDADRIYRVAVDRALPDGSIKQSAYTENALMKTMLEGIPEIEQGTRLCRNPWWGKALLTNSKDTYYNDQGLYVDSTFFKTFSFSFLRGDPGSAFTEPSSVILTERLAKSFFGEENPLGKTLVFTHYQFKEKPLHVSGVIENIPDQSHFTFDFLVPISSTLATIPYWKEDTWATDVTTSSYIKIHAGVSLQDVQEKIRQLVTMSKEQNRDVYSLQPLAGLNGIHLSSHRDGELAINNDKLYIKVLAIMAFFILLIACINYVNLATARSAMRAKEIGVRKVVGAARRSLIRQFLSESILTSMVAGLITIGLTGAVLPFFNTLMQKQLSLFSQSNQLVFFLIAGVVFFVGVFAGLYPAFYLSGFKELSVLKNLRGSAKSGLGLRQVLVVFQFALATLLIVGVIIVQKQMNLMQSANLGFDQDQVIVVKNFSGGDRNFVKRNALAQLPGVINVGSSGQEVGLMDESWMRFMHLKDSDNQQAIM